MLKFSFETQKQELKTWVDPNTGSLNIQIGKETVIIPTETGMELISVLRQKQAIYSDVKSSRSSTWNKFIGSIGGEQDQKNEKINKKSLKAA
jgi:hypothetical protein